MPRPQLAREAQMAELANVHDQKDRALVDYGRLIKVPFPRARGRPNLRARLEPDLVQSGSPRG